jgi:hypothetical protein
MHRVVILMQVATGLRGLQTVRGRKREPSTINLYSRATHHSVSMAERSYRYFYNKAIWTWVFRCGYSVDLIWFVVLNLQSVQAKVMVKNNCGPQ